MPNNTVKKSNPSAEEIISAVQHKQRRWKLGCLAMVGAFLGLLIIALIGSQRDSENWKLARPQNISEPKWAQKREMCERIYLGAIECAARSDKEVTALSDTALKRDLDKVCADENPSAATVEARKIVRAALKSPASADFVSGSTRTTHDSCFWAVSGEVDAQNSFGAQLRSSYYVELRRTAKDLWLPLKVRVQ